MGHYKATVEYDGTALSGFQRQHAVRTVQGELERVLTGLQGGEPVEVRGAGRTDAGVHATGQVVDFRLRWRRDEGALRHALNGLLPEDVAVRAVERAPVGFHPRYDALSRRYHYTLLNAPERQPLLRRTTYHEPWPLDVGAMEAALQQLLGTHDFASFGRAPAPSESTTRTLLWARAWREGALVRVGLEANAFLFRMVRSIVGSLLPVGRGEQPPEWFASLLAAQDRGEAGATIPPSGLCLVAVRYPGDPEPEPNP